MSKSDSTKKADDLANEVTALRAALEGAADGVVSTDEQGRVTSWNKKFLNIWGVARGTRFFARHPENPRIHRSAIEGFRAVPSPNRGN